MSRSLLFPVLTSLLLCLITIFFFSFYGRYEPEGDELLSDTTFHQGLSQWSHAGNINIQSGTTEAILTETVSGDVTQLSQEIPEFKQYTYLLLACDFATANVQAGDSNWKKARVILIFYDSTGKGMYYYPHVLVEKTGTHDWRHYWQVFSIPPAAAKARVSIQLLGTTGQLQVRNLSLQPVVEKTAFQHYRTILIVTWIAATGWILTGIVRKRRLFVSSRLYILVALVITIGTLMPQQIKSVLDRHIEQAAASNEAMDKTTAGKLRYRLVLPISPARIVYKSGHILMFILLSFLIELTRPRRTPAWQILACLLTFALCTEVLQLFVEARKARWQDMLIDTVGIALGLIGARWLHSNGPKQKTPD